MKIKTDRYGDVINDTNGELINGGVKNKEIVNDIENKTVKKC